MKRNEIHDVSISTLYWHGLHLNRQIKYILHRFFSAQILAGNAFANIKNHSLGENIQKRKYSNKK